MRYNIVHIFLVLIFSVNCNTSPKIFLVFGAKGWIGGKLMALIKAQKHEVYAAEARLEDRQAIVKDLQRYNPDFVINSAGVTGRPNVDWCEDHKQETIRANIIGALNLADVCYQFNIHMTNFGTGCIYEYDAAHLMGSGKGFKEEEEPNFDGSFYSKTKIMLDKLLQNYPNVLNLRLRMPISDDLSERNFVTKISRYKKVVNIPNSMTVLTDLLPISIEMALSRLIGVYNFVNPGTISHNEILELYRQYIDQQFTYENFSVEEQNKILKSKRSNNELDSTKLVKKFPQIDHIKKSIIGVFERMKHNLGEYKSKI